MPHLLKTRLPLFAAALWWGSLSAISFMAVPLVFRLAPTRAQGGAITGPLFSAQVWLSLACGLVLLLCLRSALPPAQGPAPDGRSAAPQPLPPAPRPDMGSAAFVILGMLLALVQQYAVAPRIQLRLNPALWHSLGMTLVLAQWLCAAITLWRTAAPGGSAKTGA